MKHLKHAKLQRPTLDQCARKDIGVFGNGCSKIAAFCSELAAQLVDQRVLYVDTDHNAFDNPSYSNQEHAHFAATFIQTDETASHQGAQYDQRFNASRINFDLALINSNHFDAPHVVVFFNEKKHASVLKRKAYLANCLAVVVDENSEFPQELQELLPAGCAVFSYEERMQVAPVIQAQLSRAPLKGLVLAGGRSTRMGRDKTKFNIHGKPQFEYIADLMTPHCAEVFVSQSNVHQVSTDLPTLNDAFTNLGPFGAILTAFQTDPNAAWLVMASDLPFADEPSVKKLVDARSSSKLATAFFNEQTDFPDPLFTIWEPKAYPRLLEFLALGYSCPRKVLINSPINMITPDDSKVLFNMNTPSDVEKVKGM